MFMLHVCMWRDLCSKIACCVEAAHNTHPRATRTSTTPPRRAPLAHSSLCTCTVLCWPELVLRARPPLAGGVPWSPTRDHGPCEARAKQLRLSLGDDAHQEEQRARAHVSLTAPFVANPALKICGQLLRVARVAALRERHLPWEHGRALFVAFMGLDISASIFSAAWQAYFALRHSRAAPTPSSASSSATFISASSASSHCAP